MCISHRCTTGETIGFSQRGGRPAILTTKPGELFRQRVRSAESRDGALDDPPGLFVELHVFNILGKIIQPAEQAEGIPQRGDRRMTEACSHAQPGLLPGFDHHPIFDGLNVDGESGVSA